MSAETKDFDKLWDYSNPQKTEAAFREYLPFLKKDSDEYWQLVTQIARAQGLQRHFAEAHQSLHEVEKNLPSCNTLTKTRYALERGRVFNSAQESEKAFSFFIEARAIAEKSQLDFYTVDAIHMLAIVEKDPAHRLQLNLQAIKTAESSTQEKAKKWLASLYNNTGWSLHDAKRYDEALALFRKALDLRLSEGNAGNIRVAKWCVARTLRSLQRIHGAWQIQKELEAEHARIGSADGYVCEELAELALLKKDRASAKEYFAKAYAELSKDAWFASNEVERLQRLKALGLGSERE